MKDKIVVTEENKELTGEEVKVDEILQFMKEQYNLHKLLPAKTEEIGFSSDQDQEFIENSVELVLNRLCPNYPVKERSGYFELGNFFVLIQLHNSKNHLIVGMKTEHNMSRELLELSFVFTEKGGFKITDFPDHVINNLVFKFFIELRKEIDKKRIVKARSSKFQKLLQNWKDKLSVKNAWEL